MLAVARRHFPPSPWRLITLYLQYPTDCPLIDPAHPSTPVPFTRVNGQHASSNMQSYPSPNAVAADNSGPYYSTPSTQQQPGLAHTDDLQLAELSRGLAPIIHANQTGGIPDGHDPRSRGAMNHHYENENHPSGHMQGSHPMGSAGSQYGTPDASMPPRKRSKVSRACDECRRKKIRCDATGEENKDHCSNCKRVGSRCQFSRIPMKRGPSKGYATLILLLRKLTRVP